MQFLLTLIFIGLLFGNVYICLWLVPDASENLDAYIEFWFRRSQVYEAMFLVALSIPLFKRTRHSYSLVSAAVVLIAGSFIDKLTGWFTYHYHDLYLMVGASFVYYIQYKRYRRFTTYQA